MGIKGTLAKTLNAVLKPLGVQVTKANGSSMDAALDRLRKNAMPIGTVIDVGASNGKWSLIAKARFPNAKFLLIEALEEHREELERLKQRTPHIEYSITACGASSGEIVFDVASDLDGSGISHDTRNCGRKVPMTSIDILVGEMSLPPPYLIKLDTHGFEVPIISGAAKTLRNTNALIIEAYNFQLCPGSLRFHEMCAHLDGLGFRCFDLTDPLYRLHDGLFWQADLFFARHDWKPFNYSNYR